MERILSWTYPTILTLGGAGFRQVRPTFITRNRTEPLFVCIELSTDKFFASNCINALIIGNNATYGSISPISNNADFVSSEVHALDNGEICWAAAFVSESVLFCTNISFNNISHYLPYQTTMTLSRSRTNTTAVTFAARGNVSCMITASPATSGPLPS